MSNVIQDSQIRDFVCAFGTWKYRYGNGYDAALEVLRSYRSLRFQLASLPHPLRDLLEYQEQLTRAASDCGFLQEGSATWYQTERLAQDVTIEAAMKLVDHFVPDRERSETDVSELIGAAAQ
jgi:hypothetical protein